MLRALEVLLAMFLLTMSGVAAMLTLAAIASGASAPQQAALASIAIACVVTPAAALAAISILRYTPN
jgi:hypothetical protein